jgi:hypothetical protein
MNFSVYQDTGTEIHGYLVPDGLSTQPRIYVRINGENKIFQVACWVFVEGARSQGLHNTGNVGFVLNDENVPGISLAAQVEISEPETGIVFYRRAQPGQFIPRKVLRVETSYVPSSELDLCLKPHFQFFENGVEHHGFETVRQMMEILHQPSVYVSGRILTKNFRIYIDYNIDTTMISLRDPFYELAMRLIVFSRYNKHNFKFVSPRDKILFKPIMDLFDGLPVQDEAAVERSIRNAPKDVINLLSSPFVRQLVADSPSDLPDLDDVARALDALSAFTLFDAGRDDATYPHLIEELFELPEGTVQMKPQLELVRRLADVLRKIGRVEQILEADLVLFHFIRKADDRVKRG